MYSWDNEEAILVNVCVAASGQTEGEKGGCGLKEGGDGVNTMSIVQTQA